VDDSYRDLGPQDGKSCPVDVIVEVLLGMNWSLGPLPYPGVVAAFYASLGTQRPVAS